MSQNRTLRLSVGEFKCDVTGFDDPLAILARVIGLFAQTDADEIWTARHGGPSAPALRAGFDELVRREAETVGADFSLRDGRLTFTPRSQPAPAAPERTSTQVFKAPPGFDRELERMRARLREESERRPAAKAGPAPLFAREIGPGERHPCESGGAIPHAAFLRGADMDSLANLLEAAAAWLAVSEGKTIFSSRDAFAALTDMEGAAGVDGKFGWSARKSAFLDLVESKSFQPVGDGKYMLSRETLCAYERRLRA